MSPGSKNRSPRKDPTRLAQRKNALWLRARMIQAVRGFFTQRGYLEVETPLLIPAPAPERHILPIPIQDRFLHTSPELCMKRLLSAGYTKEDAAPGYTMSPIGKG